MNRITHDLEQGTPEWDAFRLEHDGASESAAALGISKKTSRNELLNIKFTGTPKQFSDFVREKILDPGHEVEALARPIVERIIGHDLYPVTCSIGRLSASCDGLTLNGKIAFEHKQWNQGLAAAVVDGNLPEEYMPQCQQIMMVTGADLVKFVVSDGTEENMKMMDVRPDPEWFDRIRAGWEQFHKDLSVYVPRQLAEKPTAEAIMQLPALSVHIHGQIMASNLPQFKEKAEYFIANINTDLKTDQDFSDAEATVKFCAETEKKLELAKAAALSQTADIDELLRTIDNIKEQMRTKRLVLEKLVTSQKEVIKAGILSAAKVAFGEHVAGLEAEMRPLRLVYTPPDFVGAMKNKRTLASLHNAVDSTLAAAKIDTDAIAKAVRGNHGWFKEYAKGHEALFADLQSIIYKPESDFELLVESRVDASKREAEAKLEAERARIAEQERIKAEAKVRAEQAAIVKAEQERKAQEAADQRAAEALEARLSTSQQREDTRQAEMAGAVLRQRAADPSAEETRKALLDAIDIGTGVLQVTDGAVKHVPIASIIQRKPATGPTDDQIIEVLALHFRVHESKVIEWLVGMDLTAASERMAVNI